MQEQLPLGAPSCSPLISIGVRIYYTHTHSNAALNNVLTLSTFNEVITYIQSIPDVTHIALLAVRMISDNNNRWCILVFHLREPLTESVRLTHIHTVDMYQLTMNLRPSECQTELSTRKTISVLLLTGHNLVFCRGTRIACRFTVLHSEGMQLNRRHSNPICGIAHETISYGILTLAWRALNTTSSTTTRQVADCDIQASHTSMCLTHRGTTRDHVTSLIQAKDG